MSKQPVRTSIDEINVWIVEDDDMYRNTVAAVIENTEGLRCEHAFSSCEEALAAMKKEFAPVVMLMDIVLPGGMDGIKGVELIKQISPATEILMLTIHEEDDKVFKAICSGASGYLLKSSSTGEIIGSINDVVSGGRPMNAQIAQKVLSKFAELAKPRGEVYNLTAREKEILSHLIDGLSKQQIAEKLFLAPTTVITHIKNIYTKLHVHSLAELFHKLFPPPLL
jgi:DNA-binding NarL/FixJ family response regulator